MQGKCLGAVRGWPGMPAPVAVLVEVDGEPVFQADIAYCAICRGPCKSIAVARGARYNSKIKLVAPLARYFMET